MEKKSLKDFQEFSEERFTKRIIYKEGESTVFLLNFMPGQKLPPHKHPGSDVFLTVLEGNGTFNIDEQLLEVTKGDIVHCNGEENLSFENNGSDSVTLHVVLSKVPNENYAKNI